MYKLYQYNDNEFRIVCTKDNNNNVFFESNSHIVDDEEIQRISLSRSKRTIREYVKCNNFKYFVTLTINSNSCDRYSLTECQSKAKKIFKSIKRINHDFIYLFITERHKDGAYHFHGVCSDLPLYVNYNGYYSCTYFDKLGYNSFSLIRSQSKCSNYITKYVTKDCVRNNARLYLLFFSWS